MPRSTFRDFLGVGADHSCSHLIRSEYLVMYIFEVALFGVQIKDIHALCDIELSILLERAILLNNRETVIYCKWQTMDIN